MTTSRPNPFARRAAHERALASFIPFSSVVADGVVLLRNGDLMASWELEGYPAQTATTGEVEALHEAFCTLLAQCQDEAFQCYRHRVSAPETPHQPVARDGFAHEFTEAYAQQLRHVRFTSARLFVTLVYRPVFGAARLLRAARRARAELAADLDAAIATLEARAVRVAGALRALSPQRLGRGQRAGIEVDTLEEFLSLLVNGSPATCRHRPGPLYERLPRVRLSALGPSLERRGLADCGYSTMLDVAGFAGDVALGALDCLLYADFAWIETIAFAPLRQRAALAALRLQKKQLEAAEDVVPSELAAMEQAIDAVGDGEYTMGVVYYVLNVLGATEAESRRNAAEAAGAVSQASPLTLVPVDVAADAAYFAQWPGNLRWAPRRATISTRAFAALAANHGFAAGKRLGNPWGHALCALETPSGHPFYLSLHASPPKADSEGAKLPGNTVILGATGAGKTTLEAALLTCAQAYDPAPTLVVFDYDHGMEIFVRALGGSYRPIELNTPSGLNPLAWEPTPARRAFWARLVELCLATDGLPVLPGEREAIVQAVDAVASFPPVLRRFSALAQHLPAVGDRSPGLRFRRWCEDGELGWVFDNPGDALLGMSAARVIGLDYTAFLDVREVRLPLMHYLLHFLDELTDGRRLIYAISEFWKALRDEQFADAIRTHQKTIRKKNALGIFDTQQVDDIAGSPIARAVIEQSATKLFLPNANARAEDYIGHFGLTPEEFGLVQSLPGQRRGSFLVRQGRHASVCTLDLSTLPGMLDVLSGTTEAVALLHARVLPETGDNPAAWLPVLRRELARERTRSHHLTETNHVAAA